MRAEPVAAVQPTSKALESGPGFLFGTRRLAQDCCARVEFAIETIQYAPHDGSA
jgi:hypothetical protein